MRITPKFITACRCKHGAVHGYCKTAQIIQTSAIFCTKCDVHFQLKMSKRNFSVARFACRYLIYVLLVCTVVGALALIDGKMKCSYSGAQNSSEQSGIGSFIEQCVEIRAIIQLIIIITPLFLWSLFYSVSSQKNKEASLSYVETLSYNEANVSRMEAKQNLHQLRESNLRRKIENMLFDRLWYENREEVKRKWIDETL